MTAATSWTPKRVEERLIAAFRRLPACPVYGVGRRLQVEPADRAADRVAETLRWAALLDADPVGRKYLWAWARCQATRNSFGSLCDEMNWPRSTAEARRRRAAAALCHALARQPA